MAVEIERKFLVIGDAWREDVRRTRFLRQGYLAYGGLACVRVRVYDDETAMLTIKSANAGRNRNEFEYPVLMPDAAGLLALCQCAIIEKTRHEVPGHDLVWEVDVFFGENDGLVLLEFELDHENQPIDQPSWLWSEVTSDSLDYNSYLSQNPFRRW